MRFIDKSRVPLAFANWKNRQRISAPQNMTWQDVPVDIKNSLKREMLEEQGYLCAYTMQRLHDVNNCHIEHILPRDSSPERDLDYGNMVACFPHNGGDTSHGYGAPMKGGVEVTFGVDFISPLERDCQSKFRYDPRGGVTSAGDDASRDTIQTLRLDHRTLVDLRARAIESHGLTLRPQSGRARRPLRTPEDARRLAIDVLKPDINGELEPFCVAISQVALEYADKEERRLGVA